MEDTKMNRKTPLKNLRCCFSLQQGEISEPFETDFGFHNVFMLRKIKGQEIELRHILLTPSVSEEAELPLERKSVCLIK
jgi:peptidyl-prolyl cis-trans isomerase SurA